MLSSYAALAVNPIRYIDDDGESPSGKKKHKRREAEKRRRRKKERRENRKPRAKNRGSGNGKTAKGFLQRLRTSKLARTATALVKGLASITQPSKGGIAATSATQKAIEHLRKQKEVLELGRKEAERARNNFLRKLGRKAGRLAKYLGPVGLGAIVLLGGVQVVQAALKGDWKGAAKAALDMTFVGDVIDVAGWMKDRAGDIWGSVTGKTHLLLEGLLPDTGKDSSENTTSPLLEKNVDIEGDVEADFMIKKSLRLHPLDFETELSDKKTPSSQPELPRYNPHNEPEQAPGTYNLEIFTY